MLTTAEVRWFHNESMPGAIVDWFHEARFPPQVESRQDRYLALPGCTCVGVKLRNDRLLDIKAMRDPPREVLYSNGVAGRAGTWVKWSAPAPFPREALSAIGCEGPEWVALRKRRWTRKYALAGAEPENVPHDTNLDAGCDLEIVEIAHGHSTWWSLAFEAFGSPDDVSLLLQRIADSLFKVSAPPAPLNAGNSLSYPAWLASLSHTWQDG